MIAQPSALGPSTSQRNNGTPASRAKLKRLGRVNTLVPSRVSTGSATAAPSGPPSTAAGLPKPYYPRATLAPIRTFLADHPVSVPTVTRRWVARVSAT